MIVFSLFLSQNCFQHLAVAAYVFYVTFDAASSIRAATSFGRET